LIIRTLDGVQGRGRRARGALAQRGGAWIWRRLHGGLVGGAALRDCAAHLGARRTNAEGEVRGGHGGRGRGRPRGGRAAPIGGLCAMAAVAGGPQTYMLNGYSSSPVAQAHKTIESRIPPGLPCM